ncbi:fimbrial protein FimV [Acinetobacter pseudolwoffii]|uniref:fimbrial protein FimV n=1 Tax=Acinetobacter pseudolwoffii TaxID=2053287 RepID=UPI000C234657|nr:fimbrial protein FimV [Acinetobacter pseudolwoffii]PJI28820.1 fimbrial protein FimV [Acinetobacter pseudolwoffii]
MLIYVIPLVILIIVLIVVKKRQDAQESDKAKTKTLKSQKPSTATKVTPQKTKVVQSSGVENKAVVPLSPETRKKIEGLIQESNFFAAEAQINQALNRDNSQHELYLLLLDIHILQKDDFAITQLINHIRALSIDDILAQAEEKRTVYEKIKETETKQASLPATPTSDTTDFDALTQSVRSEDTKSDLIFEQLQQEITPVKEEQAPLEFNFTPGTRSASPIEKKTSLEESNSFDFNSTSSFTKDTPTEPASKASNEVQFDFESLKVETATPEVVSSITPNSPETDFNTQIGKSQIPNFDLKLEVNNEQLPTTTEEITPLDFSFSIETPAPVAEKTSEPAIEFDLSSLSAAAPVSESATQTDLSSGLDFKLDHTETKPATTGVTFDIPATPVQTATDQHDPLVQSFPELLDVNEASLNLDLAQQYIQLGAYVAAREIIAEREAEYTAEQQQRAEQLLNQIAS